MKKIIILTLSAASLFVSSCQKQDLIYGNLTLTEEEQKTHRVVCDMYVNNELLCRKVTIQEYKDIKSKCGLY